MQLTVHKMMLQCSYFFFTRVKTDLRHLTLQMKQTVSTENCPSQTFSAIFHHLEKKEDKSGHETRGGFTLLNIKGPESSFTASP